MRRMRLALPALLIAVLTYCSSSSAPKGPVQFGLLSGDHQTVRAGADSLLQPVIGQAYRQKNGSLAFRLLGPAPLAAQTQIGTGVANILTCSSPVGPAGMTAYVQCAQTDASGMVTYWYQPGTIATDSACAEIRATPNGQPAVLATTCSTVEPGPVASWQLNIADVAGVILEPGDTVDISMHLGAPALDLDAYHNRISPDDLAAYPDSAVAWAWFDYSSAACSSSWCPNKPSAPTGKGWVTVVPDPAALDYKLNYDGDYRLGLMVWIGGVEADEPFPVRIKP